MFMDLGTPIKRCIIPPHAEKCCLTVLFQEASDKNRLGIKCTADIGKHVKSSGLCLVSPLYYVLRKP